MVVRMAQQDEVTLAGLGLRELPLVVIRDVGPCRHC